MSGFRNQENSNDVTLNTSPGVDIGDVTVNNEAGASAVNIQDGGNTITVDGTVDANCTLGAETTKVIGTVNLSSTDNGVLDNIDGNTDYGVVVGGGAEATALRVTLANNSTGLVSVDDGGSTLSVDGTITANLSDTDNAVLDNIDANTGTKVINHGSNLDIDTAAEQITATDFACTHGVLITAGPANDGILYVGLTGVTAGDTAATDGLPIMAGDSAFFPVTNVNLLYAIASAVNQKVFWAAS
uniref:Uncharacterized protein n=1 Tax=viral metagenome TaxID=1070528 RepID=A0A6M3KGT5_9ZZZZ